MSAIIEAQGIQFTVYGAPVPQGSKRALGKNIVEMQSVRLRTWRQDIAGQAREAMQGASPYLEPVDVRMMFFLSRPQAHFGTGRNSERLKPSAPIAPKVKPDLDKLVRAALDAMTGIVFKDDSQVVSMTVSKLYAQDQFHPGLMVGVMELAPH